RATTHAPSAGCTASLQSVTVALASAGLCARRARRQLAPDNDLVALAQTGEHLHVDAVADTGLDRAVFDFPGRIDRLDYGFAAAATWLRGNSGPHLGLGGCGAIGIAFAGPFGFAFARLLRCSRLRPSAGIAGAAALRPFGG